MPDPTRRVLQVIAFLCLAALTGIIGNRADAIVQEALPLINQTVKIKLWAFTLLLLITPSPAVYLLAKYKKALQSLGELSALDDRLLRLLVKMRRDNKPQASENLVEDFLVDILKALDASGSCGISIYRRDSRDPNCLTRWKSSSRPLEDSKDLKFFVGDSSSSDQSKKRGIAGKTFRDKKTRVVHLTSKDGRCVSDDPDYLMIQKEPYIPPYQTLITIPITTNVNDDSESLGVLCLYSGNRSAFDSGQVKDLITSLAKRLSIMMLSMSLPVSRRW